MSRAHIHGYDTNAAQFERMGNPWHGEPMTRSARKKWARKYRPCRAGLPRRPERSSRDESEAMLDLQCKQRIRQLVEAARGTSRTVAATEPPKSPMLAKIEHPARTELTRWQAFERQVTRLQQRGAVLARLAEGMERNRLRDEKARLKAIIKAAEARLAGIR